MSGTPDKAKSVFLNALEIASAEERRRYLDAQCSGDDALRCEVEELLRHHAEMGDYLESAYESLAVPQSHPLVAERPGEIIGRYKLLEEIGEGGFGVVYMAEQQEPVRRTRGPAKALTPGRSLVSIRSLRACRSRTQLFDSHVAVPDRLGFVLESDVAFRRTILQRGLAQIQVNHLFAVELDL